MARIKVQVAGVQQTIKRIKGMADQRAFKRVRVMVGGVMQTVFQFFTVTLTTTSVSGSVSSPINADVTTSAVGVVAIGGTPAITYLWSVATVGSGAWNIDSPTAATTTFTCTNVAPGDGGQAEFICTATDADSNIAITGHVEAVAFNFG